MATRRQASVGVCLTALVGLGVLVTAPDPDGAPRHAAGPAGTPHFVRPAVPSRARRPAGPSHARRPAVTIQTIGYSVRHRPIRVHIVGDPAARRRILVVGCTHGDERAGLAITRRLHLRVPPDGLRWWIVDALNPDGCRGPHATRQNAHGVDLNRNSPWHWRVLDPPGGMYYAGTGPLSEPESRAINRLIRRVRPAASVWYHQHAALVDTSSGGDIAIERRYARTAHLALRSYGVVPGSITTWQDHRFPHTTAFVVELPPGPLSSPAVARHVRAVEGL